MTHCPHGSISARSCPGCTPWPNAAIEISPAAAVRLGDLLPKATWRDREQPLPEGSFVFIPMPQPGVDRTREALTSIDKAIRWGEWAEKHSEWIRVALKTLMSHQPRGRISPYERALDSMPDRFPELVARQLYDAAGNDNGVEYSLPSHTKPTELEPT